MAWQGQTARPEGVPSLAVAGRDGCPWRHRGRRGSKGGQAAGPSRHASVGRGSAPACERPARRRLVPDVLLDASLSGWAWPSGWSQVGGLLDDKAGGLTSWVGGFVLPPPAIPNAMITAASGISAWPSSGIRLPAHPHRCPPVLCPSGAIYPPRPSIGNACSRSLPCSPWATPWMPVPDLT